MKKSDTTSSYNKYRQEINTNFLATSNPIYSSKSDFMSLCSQITIVFQEKLAIIYANIRV